MHGPKSTPGLHKGLLHNSLSGITSSKCGYRAT